MVFPPARGEDRCVDPEGARFRFFRASRRSHHRPVAQAHRNLLRHDGHREVSPKAQAALVSPPDHRTVGRDGVQRHLHAALGAEARGLRPDQLHPAQPSAEVRGNLRHAGRGRTRQAQAGRSRAQPSGAHDDQPAETPGELGRRVPSHASVSRRQYLAHPRRNRRIRGNRTQRKRQ